MDIVTFAWILLCTPIRGFPARSHALTTGFLGRSHTLTKVYRDRLGSPRLPTRVCHRRHSHGGADVVTALLILIVLAPLVYSGVVDWRTAPPYLDDDDL